MLKQTRELELSLTNQALIEIVRFVSLGFRYEYL